MIRYQWLYDAAARTAVCDFLLDDNHDYTNARDRRFVAKEVALWVWPDQGSMITVAAMLGDAADETDLLATAAVAAANNQHPLLNAPELFEAETLVAAIAGTAAVVAALDDDYLVVAEWEWLRRKEPAKLTVLLFVAEEADDADDVASVVADRHSKDDELIRDVHKPHSNPIRRTA